MKNKDNGGPAFPRSGYDYQEEEGGRLQLACDAASGMTLRDYFAGQALMAMLSNTDCLDKIHDVTPDMAAGAKMLAWAAYLHADAMLTERKKGADDAQA